MFQFIQALAVFILLCNNDYVGIAGVYVLCYLVHITWKLGSK